jgi:hypothetical protein
MTREEALFWIGAYYFVSMFLIDLVCIGTAIFTQLTFAEFGRVSTAKRLINDGLVLTASAWTLFVLGVIPEIVNPLPIGWRVACILIGVLFKVTGQSMQAIGWCRFWLAMRDSFDQQPILDWRNVWILVRARFG